MTPNDKLKLKRSAVRAHIADLIQKQVGYFNGWSVTAEAERLDCEDAADDVLAYLRRKKLLRALNLWKESP